MVEALASLNIRSICTCPSPDFAIAVARPDSTARTAASASMVLVSPRRRLSPRSVGLTSITVTVSERRGGDNAAPQEPVHSTGTTHDAEPSGPEEHRPAARGSRREAAGGQQNTQRGEHRGDVDIFVRIHPQ